MAAKFAFSNLIRFLLLLNIFNESTACKAARCPIEPEWRQMCGKNCRRASDLALHLQSCHSRQLAMLFHRMGQDAELLQYLRGSCMSCGGHYSAAELVLHLREAHSCVRPAVAFYMEQLLPVFHALQLNDYQCNFCHQIFNLPAEMRTDETASARQLVAQSHLKCNCPVLLQISLLLASLLQNHGQPHGSSRLPDPTPDGGGLPDPASTHRQDAQTGSKPQGQQTTSKNRAKRARFGSRSDGRGRAASHADSSAPCKAGDPSGSGTQHTSQIGSIHTFFESRPKRSIPTPPGLHDQVEAADGAEGCSLAPPETISGGGAAEGTSCSSGATGGMPAIGCPVPDGPGKGDDPPGSKLSLPQVGCGEPEIDSRPKDTDQCEEDESTLGGTHRNVQRPPADSALPCFEAAYEPGIADHTMEASVEFEIGQTIRALLPADSQCDLDDHGSKYETTHSGSDRPCNGPGEAGVPTPEGHEGGGQRQEQVRSEVTLSPEPFDEIAGFVRVLCGIKLCNDSNWCYANATIISLLWVLLSIHDGMHGLWGARFSDFRAFLHRAKSGAVALSSEPWFQQILSIWGKRIGQHDCAEFSSAVLVWLNSLAFSMRWERRVEVTDVVQIHDHGERFMPLQLQFSHALDFHGSCTLTDLVSIWSQVDSMKAGLVIAPPCVCLQIERFLQDADGNLFKSQCHVDLEAEVTIPFFASSDLRLETADYVVVAGSCHLGADLAGHYRSLLKLQPGLDSAQKPIKWMLTDDDLSPQTCWDVPPWFACNITMAWLIRADCLQVHPFQIDMTRAATIPAEDTHAALIELLRSQDGINGQMAGIETSQM